VERTEHDGPGDLAGMQGLAQRVFPDTGYRSIGALAWNYALYYDRPKTCPTALWRDGGEVVAWAWVERPDELMLQVDPRYPALADEALAWAESMVDGPLSVIVSETETLLLDALLRRGYAEHDAPFFVSIDRALTDLPVRALPDGYTIRPAGTDAAARAAAQRAAFGDSEFTTERQAHLWTIWPYRPEMDLVVEAPDGTLAAYCLGWYDAVNRVGELEPVGTHPDHRRRGLSAAACTAVMEAFRAAGGVRAIVHPRGDAGYPIPKIVYESIGFGTYARTRTYRRSPSREDAS
jgi:GNAT superfamily N-acetyltransferase